MQVRFTYPLRQKISNFCKCQGHSKLSSSKIYEFFSENLKFFSRLFTSIFADIGFADRNFVFFPSILICYEYFPKTNRFQAQLFQLINKSRKKKQFYIIDFAFKIAQCENTSNWNLIFNYWLLIKYWKSSTL